MTTFFLDKLIQHCRIAFPPGGRPTTEIDMVNMLINHAIPGADAALIRAALDAWGKKVDEARSPESILASRDNFGEA